MGVARISSRGGGKNFPGGGKIFLGGQNQFQGAKGKNLSNFHFLLHFWLTFSKILAKKV